MSTPILVWVIAQQKRRVKQIKEALKTAGSKMAPLSEFEIAEFESPESAEDSVKKAYRQKETRPRLVVVDFRDGSFINAETITWDKRMYLLTDMGYNLRIPIILIMKPGFTIESLIQQGSFFVIEERITYKQLAGEIITAVAREYLEG